MNTVLLGDIRLEVEDRGSSRADQAVLLLVHGFPLDHTMWQSQIEFFGARGRVVAPDLRGFGASRIMSLPKGSDNPAVSMRTYADDLNALLDKLEIDRPVVFCGLSMGGYVAWQFCANYADRVAALVACDTRSIADTPQAQAGRVELTKRVLAEGIEPVVAAMLPKFFGPNTVAKRLPCVGDTVAAIERAWPGGIAAALGAMASRPDMTESLAAIRVPALVVCGEHDAISPVEEMRGIAERIADSEFVVIPGAGHMSPLEDPAAFNAALERFLREKAGW